MIPIKTNLDIKYALEILIAESKAKETQEVGLMDSLGCVLAEDIRSDSNIPPFNRSPLDGYAVRSEDISSASKECPVSLNVVDFIPAGKPSQLSVGKHEAMKIMTGAKIPLGADVVIPFEKTHFTEHEVTIFEPYKSMSNICLEGEDIKIGDKVLRKGALIDAPEIGILASVGKNVVKVYPKPIVAILATGDELVNIDDKLAEGQIRNSNSYTLAALVKNIGCEAIIVDNCSDELKATEKRLVEISQWADIIITTGGVSVGDKDYVTTAFQNVCGKFLFWRVKMKPGTPITAGKIGETILFGLSGNPAAAFITYQIFVKPVILKTCGRENINPLVVESTLLNSFDKVSKQNRFVRAKTYYRDNQFYTELPTKHSSGVISSLTGVNSLLFIPSNEGPYKKGDLVNVQFLDQVGE